MSCFGSRSIVRAVRRGPRCAAVLAILAIASITWVQPVTASDTEAPAKDVARPEAAALDQKLLKEIKSGSEVMKNLAYLSDVIGCRLTGSPSLQRANEWAAERMKSYGLESVHQEPWTIPVAWERGTATARIIEPDTGRTLIVASMGWSPGTKGKVVGDVVIMNARNSADLKQYKGKLKNAIILQGAPRQVRPFAEAVRQRGAQAAAGGGGPDRNARATGPGGQERTGRRGGGGGPGGAGAFGGRGEEVFRQMMSFRRELSEFLRTEGAAAIFMDAGKPHNLMTMTGAWRGEDRASAPEPIPSLFVGNEHYALLHRLASRPAPARTRVELEVTNKFIPGPVAVFNTVGEIKGSEKPNEFVVLGADLDSWDLASGTTDNGTGSCVVLETARALVKSGVRPKRTIRFVLFTGEEQGLFGSKVYVDKHKDEMPRTSMCLVHDTGTGKVTGLGLNGREVLKPIFETELAGLKEIGPIEFGMRGGFGGSDHASFDRAGVPGLMLQQDMSEYSYSHHSQADTFDKAHEENLVQGAQVMAVIATRVANLDRLLPRDKPERERRPAAPTEPQKKEPEKKKEETKAPAKVGG